METLPPFALQGQNIPAQGKNSGRTPLFLPWENSPNSIKRFDRIRHGGTADSIKPRTLWAGQWSAPSRMPTMPSQRGCQKIVGKTQLGQGGEQTRSARAGRVWGGLKLQVGDEGKRFTPPRCRLRLEDPSSF